MVKEKNYIYLRVEKTNINQLNEKINRNINNQITTLSDFFAHFFVILSFVKTKSEHAFLNFNS